MHPSFSTLTATLALASQFPSILAVALDRKPSATSTEAALPYPYVPYPATVTLATDNSGRPLASLTALSQNNCGRRTAWLNTTTVDLRVPCLGATQLASSLRRGGCPNGGNGSPPDGTVQATRTRFNFVCSPTPDAKPVPALTDWETDLPAPTLPSGFRPSYTPVGVHAASYAEGWCYQRVALEPTDASVRTRECETCETCRSPTKYTATATTTVGVDCRAFEGRCTFMPLETGGVQTRCSSVPLESRLSTVTAREAKTTWKYECLPTRAP